MPDSIKIIDSHSHASKIESIGYLARMADKHNFSKFCVLSISSNGIAHLKENLICALAKIMHKGKVYAYGGLYYPEDSRPGDGDALLEQAVRLKQIGFDGMKMLEGKPDVRKKTGLPLDSPVYDKYYGFLEEEGIPLTYHVGDPRIFWDKDKAPDWAVREGWVYIDGTFSSKDSLYKEATGFLTKFPKLKVTFAHFFFMGEEGVKRASEFLDRWPCVNFDLTPGIEMYGSFSEDPESWREFFIKYQDRIIFGTDNGLDESLVYIDVVKRFLETYDEFRVREMNIEGIGLEQSILGKIYCRNFERTAGVTPARLNPEMLEEEIERIIHIVRHHKNSDILLPEVSEISAEIKSRLNTINETA